MPHITELRLKNFQAHEESVLQLSRGINVIAGPSDQGKSSFFRAVGWVAVNNLRGDAFRREGAPKNSPTEATILMERDGNVYSVSRGKSGTINYYEVDGTRLAAVGTNVPREVSDVLCMDEINIQTQHEGHFMLSLPPGQVAQAIDQLVGFDIGSTFARLGQMENRAKNDLGAAQATVDKLGGELGELPDPAVLERMLDELSQMQERVETLDLRRRTLVAFTENVVTARARMESVAVFDSREASALVESLETAHQARVQYEKTLQPIQEVLATLQSTSATLAKMPPEDELQHALDLIAQVESRRVHLTNKTQDLTSLKAAITGLEHWDTTYHELVVSLKVAQDAYNAFMVDVRVCPTCGQEMPHEQHGERGTGSARN